MRDLLKEAIADAKAVRETALLNAKAALEEAFTPQLKNMLSAKLREDEFEDEEEVGGEEEFGDEEEVPAEEGTYEDEEFGDESPRLEPGRIPVSLRPPAQGQPPPVRANFSEIALRDLRQAVS